MADHEISNDRPFLFAVNEEIDIIFSYLLSSKTLPVGTILSVSVA